MTELDMGESRNRLNRRRTGNSADDTYVIHTLEPHHTLAGIALQYRCTVEQLLRINGFGSHLDLHTKAQIRIPVSRYGALYADPSAFKSEDAGSATHTTAAPRLPTSQDRVAGGLIEGADDPDEATSNDTHAYLSSFDAQMEGAIAAMDATLAAQVRDEPLPPAAALAPQAEGLMAFYPKDWRVLFGCATAGAVAIIPLLVFYVIPTLLDNIRGPAPQGLSHQTHHGDSRMHDTSQLD